MLEGLESHLPLELRSSHAVGVMGNKSVIAPSGGLPNGKSSKTGISTASSTTVEKKSDKEHKMRAARDKLLINNGGTVLG